MGEFLLKAVASEFGRAAKGTAQLQVQIRLAPLTCIVSACFDAMIASISAGACYSRAGQGRTGKAKPPEIQLASSYWRTRYAPLPTEDVQAHSKVETEIEC